MTRTRWLLAMVLASCGPGQIGAPNGSLAPLRSDEPSRHGDPIPPADATHVSGDVDVGDPGHADPGRSSDGGGDPVGAGDPGGAPTAPIALFAINEGNFQSMAGIESYFYGCSNPSFADFLERSASGAKRIATGWSCGATYALIRAYEHADLVRGIVHIHQASIPAYQNYVEQAFQNGGEVRVPVYLVHDFGYDAGGALVREWLLNHGYIEGEDLFVMDRPDTGHDGHLTDAEKEIIVTWMKNL